MKKMIIILFVVFSVAVSAEDVLGLKNQMAFKGCIVGIEDSTIIFNAENEDYYVPFSDISFLLVEDSTKEIYSALQNLDVSDSNVNICQLAQVDASMYHGKKFGHFCLGLLFGPFSMIGTALSNPTPFRGSETALLSKNSQYFSDPVYLTCYKKKVKGQLIGTEAIGWAAWLLLLLF